MLRHRRWPRLSCEALEATERHLGVLQQATQLLVCLRCAWRTWDGARSAAALQGSKSPKSRCTSNLSRPNVADDGRRVTVPTKLGSWQPLPEQEMCCGAKQMSVSISEMTLLRGEALSGTLICSVRQTGLRTRYHTLPKR